jgi:hypothetical protein
VESSLLTRAGTTSGKVYETYLIKSGFFGYGEKPQVAASGPTDPSAIDAAALAFLPSIATNDIALYDRTRFVLHLDGAKWIGSPAGQSPTDAELATATNWQFLKQTANRAGVVAIRTNG